MPCEKKALLDFLEVINGSLTKKITLIAAGGTAMTLLDLKSSTVDIDFTLPSGDSPEFEEAPKRNPSGFKIDWWTDGHIFCQALPSDYIEKSIKIKEFSHISLRALQPVDIIATKIGRLNTKDVQDIETIIKACKIKKAELKARAIQVSPTYVPKEEDYLYHLDWIIKKFFPKTS